MSNVALALAAGIGLLLLLGMLFGRRPPGRYRVRQCQGASWRRSFPAASKHEIREFLSLFTEAFAFSKEVQLKFAPNDRILRVYRELYPHEWVPDSLELETLAALIERKYAVRFTSIWSESLTLGELFTHINEYRAQDHA